MPQTLTRGARSSSRPSPRLCRFIFPFASSCGPSPTLLEVTRDEDGDAVGAPAAARPRTADARLHRLLQRPLTVQVRGRGWARISLSHPLSTTLLLYSRTHPPLLLSFHLAVSPISATCDVTVVSAMRARACGARPPRGLVAPPCSSAAVVAARTVRERAAQVWDRNTYRGDTLIAEVSFSPGAHAVRDARVPLSLPLVPGERPGSGKTHSGGGALGGGTFTCALSLQTEALAPPSGGGGATERAPPEPRACEVASEPARVVPLKTIERRALLTRGGGLLVRGSARHPDLTRHAVAPSEVAHLRAAEDVDGGLDALAAAGDFSLALATAGGVYAFGRNTYGQLGVGHMTSLFAPAEVGDRSKRARTTTREWAREGVLARPPRSGPIASSRTTRRVERSRRHAPLSQRTSPTRARVTGRPATRPVEFERASATWQRLMRCVFVAVVLSVEAPPQVMLCPSLGVLVSGPWLFVAFVESAQL